ncbi:hypothetical protein QP572_00725 [Brevibacterium sp. UMB10442]|nr:hypothetical protein [Brevibacterium sp. UMB10442]
MTTTAEFRKITQKVSDTSWTASEESVGGVSMAVLVRRVERPENAPKHAPVTDTKQAIEALRRDTLSGKCVTKNSEKQPLTRQNAFRPKSPMGRETGLAGTDRASFLDPELKIFPPAERSGAGVSPAERSEAGNQIPGPESPGRGDSSDEGSASSVQFGDLSTVRAMGTGEFRVVIGFDTEFTEIKDKRGNDAGRRIDSYQFSCVNPVEPGVRFDIVLLPLVPGERVAVESALAVVLRESGMWTFFGLPSPAGVPRRDFWVSGDYKKSVDRLYKDHRVSIVLAGHFLKADLTTFKRPQRRGDGDGRYEDILRRVTSAGGGLVSLKPIRMMARSGPHGFGERWLPFSITVRDTMTQSASGSLAELGESCGVPKLDVGEQISNMAQMRDENLVEFLEYGANDAVIVLEYLSALWGLNVEPPVTLSGGGARALRAGVKSYWGDPEMSNAAFTARFQGLVRVKETEEVSDDGLSFYSVRSMTPVDGDANAVHSAFKHAFHGGLNASYVIGSVPGRTFDHDIQSAYPTAMASIFDVDYEAGVIEEVIKDRELKKSDFPLGFATPLVAYVSWEFPEGVNPCLPVRVGQSIIYPRTSVGAGASLGDGMEGTGYQGFEGAWCAGPELALALKLGAKVHVQIGYRLKVLEIERDGQREASRSMRHALRRMIEDRDTAKKIWGKKSLEELTLKIATNSCYGKLGQDVADRSGWNAWAEEMESIGGSSVTSPYHAAMTTSLTRALLLAISNELDVLSTTTDGFIARNESVEGYDCFGLADVFRDSREALVGDRTVWEVKHEQDDLLNLTTRGNASLQDGGVLAKAGLKTPAHIERGSSEEREWFVELAVSREGKVPNPHVRFPSFRELSRSEDRVDFGPVSACPEISLDFDMKRKPLVEDGWTAEVLGHEVYCFRTVPWEDVEEYQRGREIARTIARGRPGTTGENRPTGCLRTRDDWMTWKARFEASGGRRIRTAGSALLTELVAAHKEGLIEVPVLAGKFTVDEKIVWLCSLGYGEFTRAQWDHMSKRDRRARVLADVEVDKLKEVVETLPEW